MLDLAEDSRGLFIASLREKLGISLWFPAVSGGTSSHAILESQTGLPFSSLAFGSDDRISSALWCVMGTRDGAWTGVRYRGSGFLFWVRLAIGIIRIISARIS